jgi:hypothetical protein
MFDDVVDPGYKAPTYKELQGEILKMEKGNIKDWRT